MKKTLLGLSLALALTACGNTISSGGTGGTTTPGTGTTPGTTPTPGTGGTYTGTPIGTLNINTVTLTFTHCSRVSDGTGDVICYIKGKSVKDDEVYFNDSTRLIDSSGKSYYLKSIFKSGYDKWFNPDQYVNFISGVTYDIQIRFGYNPAENTVFHFDFDWGNSNRFSNITLK